MTKSFRTRALSMLTLLVTVALACIVFFAPSTARAQSMTDTLETALVNHLFRSTVFTAPATWYVSLHTTACSDSATGTEVTGGAYARASIASGTGTWAAPTGGNGQTSNAAAVNFTSPSASWGTVTHFALWDAASGGNQLICQILTTSKTINSGDTVTFPIGSLTVTLN